jgi:Asp/Glu/hydantoin racemase
VTKLLIINPNTTDAMTRKVETLARAMLPVEWDITAVSGRFGPRYIASRATFAVAGHAALDAYAMHGADADGVLLACFGDPGLDALREVSPVPVIGLVEAAAREAGADDRRFSIVTGGVLWETMLREMLLVRGLSSQLASIRTVAPDGGTIARDPDGALQVLVEACDACIAADEAQAVILGGAGLIGLAARVARIRRYPVICSVEAGLRAAIAADLQPGSGKRAASPVTVDSVDLSPALAKLLRSGPVACDLRSARPD